ncbi:hypothetical protein DPMN_131535 [Dreissena polymorpha]|uniref:Uncharacterized protein n=1 Tax=Dreissena polymorpha TaxID=45954 RepID=A0A9D4H6L6_DREPO|nr:hypothetical protein DPMN_131535 [Dreissena polymorpha]
MTCCGLNDALQSKWVADITEMMAEGPLVIMRLDKIRKAIIASPETLLWFSKNRMELEMLQLEFFNRKSQCDIEKRLIEILTEVEQRMLSEGSGFLHDLYDLYARIIK